MRRLLKKHNKLRDCGFTPASTCSIEGWGLAAAAVVAGGAIAGGVISSNASKSAASTAANAANAGTNAQLSMFNTTQADFAPQVQLGQGAANMLGGIYGIGGVTGPAGSKTTTGSPNPNYSAFYNTPGYQFSLNQGEAAINKSAAASGGLYSSNTLGALGGYAAGAASTEFNSYINQLTTMAGLGNAASSGVGSAATATGAGVANSLQNAGNAQMAGVLGSSNAFTNALGSVTNSPLIRNAFAGTPATTTANGAVPDANNAGWDGVYCDRRMKEHITPRFIDINKLPVYEFNYKGDATKRLGYMADEVLEKFPEAVSVGEKGFMKVHYAKVPDSVMAEVLQ
jgi:hypothetical protein